MNWEILKPLKGGSGISQPFMRVNTKENKLTLNKTARVMLEIERGGSIQVAKDQDRDAYYLVKVNDNRTSNMYQVDKNGNITDLSLPSRIAVYGGLKKDETGRVFLSSIPVKNDGKIGYRILRDVDND